MKDSLLLAAGHRERIWDSIDSPTQLLHAQTSQQPVVDNVLLQQLPAFQARSKDPQSSAIRSQPRLIDYYFFFVSSEASRLTDISRDQK